MTRKIGLIVFVLSAFFSCKKYEKTMDNLDARIEASQLFFNGDILKKLKQYKEDENIPDGERIYG